jgi:hypothetical protein
MKLSTLCTVFPFLLFPPAYAADLKHDSATKLGLRVSRRDQYYSINTTTTTTAETNSTSCSYEPLTRAVDWFNNTEQLDPDRHRWFYERQPFGPIVDDTNIIAGVLFTYSKEILKMSVLFPPLYPQESRTCLVTFTSRSDATIQYQQSCTVQDDTWHCPVRIDPLPTDDYRYVVEYRPDATFLDLVYRYEGLVQAPHGYPRVAALGCFGFDVTMHKYELLQALHMERPDLLVLQGDQTYAKTLAYGFLELVYSMHELTRNTPTIVQMDDHDYGEPNLWGAGESDEESGSGFSKPVCWINALQQQSMSHNPDPATTETLENGITIHYTAYEYDQVEFAVLETRKFKNVFDGDSLLGHDQEAWLTGWCMDNQDRVKVILSQTPFASLGTNATILYKPYGIDAIVGGSTDSNGYPVSGRNRFMDIIHGCSNLILSGDQHLGIAVTYDDYNVTDCASPAAINTVYWRLNLNEPGGTYLDGFGHEYRLLHAWNVAEDLWSLPNPYSTMTSDNTTVLAERADGFMMVDLNGATATCAMHGYRNGPSQVWSATVPAVAAMPMEV